MKKLEKMDGKLFESLKPNEMSNLASMVGGERLQTNNNNNGCQDVLYISDTNEKGKETTKDYNNVDSDWNRDNITPFEDPNLVAVVIEIETAI